LTPKDRLGLSLGDWVLALLEHAGGRVRGATRLHKVLFLVKYEVDTSLVPTGFTPHLYGPFSNELAATLETLEERKLIASRQRDSGGTPTIEYELTEKGREQGRKALEKIKEDPKWPNIKEILDFALKAPIASLLIYMQTFHPEFTESRTRHIAWPVLHA
jgi:uncharacterized protein YwgA